jgi:signal recognition particle subunit SRP72
LAVASNNFVVLKKEQDLADSYKKLKQASTQAADQKLSTAQKTIIGINKCLLALYLNKGDECNQLLKSLKEQYPKNDRLALVEAALLSRQKKAEQSEELLRVSQSFTIY